MVTITAESADLDEGDTLTLSCHYTASPPVSEAVTFTHNKEEVSQVDRGEGEVTMVVTNMTGDQAGTWGCDVTNPRGRGAAEVRVRVRRRPSVRITIRMAEAGHPGTEVRVTEATSANISLRCEVIEEEEGRRKRRRHQRHRKVESTLDHHQAARTKLTSVEWFIDDHPLYKLPQCSDDLGEDLCDVDPSILMLEKVNRQFQGAYSCIGTLGTGLSSLMSNSALLTVLYPPGEAEVRPGPGQPLPVYRGDTVSLGCEVNMTGRPASSSYTWSLDGEEISGEEESIIIIDTGTLAGEHKVRVIMTR